MGHKKEFNQFLERTGVRLEHDIDRITDEHDFFKAEVERLREKLSQKDQELQVIKEGLAAAKQHTIIFAHAL